MITKVPVFAQSDFAMCYIAAHYVLDLIDEEQATAVLEYCDENMD